MRRVEQLQPRVDDVLGADGRSVAVRQTGPELEHDLAAVIADRPALGECRLDAARRVEGGQALKHLCQDARRARVTSLGRIPCERLRGRDADVRRASLPHLRRRARADDEQRDGERDRGGRGQSGGE